MSPQPKAGSASNTVKSAVNNPKCKHTDALTHGDPDSSGPSCTWGLGDTLPEQRLEKKPLRLHSRGPRSYEGWNATTPLQETLGRTRPPEVLHKPSHPPRENHQTNVIWGTFLPNP